MRWRQKNEKKRALPSSSLLVALPQNRLTVSKDQLEDLGLELRLVLGVHGGVLVGVALRSWCLKEREKG